MGICMERLDRKISDFISHTMNSISRTLWEGCFDLGFFERKKKIWNDLIAVECLKFCDFIRSDCWLIRKSLQWFLMNYLANCNGIKIETVSLKKLISTILELLWYPFWKRIVGRANASRCCLYRLNLLVFCQLGRWKTRIFLKMDWCFITFCADTIELETILTNLVFKSELSRGFGYSHMNENYFRLKMMAIEQYSSVVDGISQKEAWMKVE